MKFIGIVILIMYMTIKVMTNAAVGGKNDIFNNCFPNYAPVNFKLDKGRGWI